MPEETVAEEERRKCSLGQRPFYSGMAILSSSSAQNIRATRARTDHACRIRPDLRDLEPEDISIQPDFWHLASTVGIECPSALTLARLCLVFIRRCKRSSCIRHLETEVCRHSISGSEGIFFNNPDRSSDRLLIWMARKKHEG
ncbi:hypothetical protein ACLOJK_016786 [Asimina triloba]